MPTKPWSRARGCRGASRVTRYPVTASKGSLVSNSESIGILGENGPVVVLLPGGAEPVDGFFPGLVEGLRTDPGCRVVLYDRPGTGAAAGIGRIASIAAPLIVPPLVAFGGTPLLFTLFSTAFLVAATTVFLLPERRGESL